MLVAVAAGRSHRDSIAELLTAAGWVTSGTAAVHPHALVRAAGDALEVLDVASGWDERDWLNRTVTPVGRALAQAALLSAR